MGTNGAQFSRFMFIASHELGFTEEEIREILKPKFEKFDQEKVPEMMLELHKKKAKRELTEWKPICPICGGSYIADTAWDGVYTKTPGWRCGTGGLEHFLWWRANNICRIRGETIPFEEKYPDGLKRPEEIEHRSTE